MSDADVKQDPGQEWAPDLVIYHDKCADGIVAAWACWKRWGDGPEYRAANYGYQPPSDVVGKNILIVDFSWPADELRAMVAAGAASIVILDHHKTAQEALDPFIFIEANGRLTPGQLPYYIRTVRRLGGIPVFAIFDMERSGARMAWDFAHDSVAAPHIVGLAEHYDLWRFEPGAGDPAELLHLDLQAGGLTMEAVEARDTEFGFGAAPIHRGAAIEQWRSRLVEEIASRAHLRTVAGVEGVISVECPYSLVSAVGHHLLDKHPAAPFAAMSVTGEKAVTWSLRSHDDRADVSEVAKSMGGGGHRNAAGFRVDLSPDAENMVGAALRLAAVRDGAGLDEVYGSEWCLDRATQFRADLADALAATNAGQVGDGRASPEPERYRHKKRGTEYTVVGAAELQMGTDLVDGSELIIYAGDDGRLWAREFGEFHDGRFEQMRAQGAGS